MVALLTGVMAALAGGASAEKPVRGPALSGPVDFPAGMVCPFAVHGEVVANRQTQTVFSDGRIAFTGFFASRIVNVENGKELTLVTPGPVFLTPAGDLLRLKSAGPLIFFFFPGDAGPGDTSTGRTYLIHGHAEVTVDPATFAFLSFDYSGRAQDLCAALA